MAVSMQVETVGTRQTAPSSGMTLCWRGLYHLNNSIGHMTLFWDRYHFQVPVIRSGAQIAFAVFTSCCSSSAVLEPLTESAAVGHLQNDSPSLIRIGLNWYDCLASFGVIFVRYFHIFLSNSRITSD